MTPASRVSAPPTVEERETARAAAAALDVTIAGVLSFPGLDTLTRAGARKVMDALIRQVSADQ